MHRVLRRFLHHVSTRTSGRAAVGHRRRPAGAADGGRGTAIIAVAVLAACGSPTGASEVAPVPSACDQDFGDPAESEFVLPFREGRAHRVIQGYCPPDPTWGHYRWYAYDFDLTTGDTIVASRAGQVVFMRENQPDIGGRCGVNGENMVRIRHDDGSTMDYVHLTANGALVDSGERVSQGEAIGLSGNSGCSAGPHLHVVLFRASSDFSRQASMPVNYRNAIGPLDANRGLRQGTTYSAGAIAPGR